MSLTITLLQEEANKETQLLFEMVDGVTISLTSFIIFLSKWGDMSRYLLKKRRYDILAVVLVRPMKICELGELECMEEKQKKERKVD